MASSSWSDDDATMSGSQDSASLPLQLTPKSKIQAMLAAIDDEPSSTMAAIPPPAFKPTLFLSDTEDDEEIQIPMNKTSKARKMQAATVADGSESDSDVPQPRPRATIQKKHAILDDESEAELAAVPSSRIASTPPSSQPSRADSINQLSGSESDALPDLQDKSRLFALAEKRRQEHEAEEAAMEAARQSHEKIMSEIMEEEDASDGSTSRKLSQHQRSQRKASKKALAQITQDQQRIERNLQLAHDARTRAKITTSSLFAKFNFRQPAPEPAPNNLPSSDGNTSGTVSLAGDTPPTSPLRDAPASVRKPIIVVEAVEPKADVKGKGKLIIVEEEPTIQAPQVSKSKKQLTQKPVRIANRKVILHDDDSDLEIVSPGKEQAPQVARKQTAVEARFARLAKSPEQAGKARGLQALALLANLHSPDSGHKKKVKQISRTQLNTSLQQRARQQAAKERLDRIEILRAKGIHVQTPEERAKEENEVEDLLAKARSEADALTKQEAEEVKRLRKLNGEDSDSEEELDYSGSDEDSEGSDGDHDMIDASADEASGNELSEDEAEPEAELEAVLELSAEPAVRRPRKLLVLSDDEEDISTPVPATSLSAKKSPILGVPMFEAPPLGLTQIFAGTMGGSAFPASGPGLLGSMLPGTMVAPSAPVVPTMLADDQILGSPTSPASRGSSDLMDEDNDISPTQMSEIPDASQDVGFQIRSPELARFTIAHDDSPVVQKTGRLLRKDQILEPEQVNAVPSSLPADSAFEKLKKASKKMQRAKELEDFKKKDSAARQMVDEQADESEDEFAGLGGASDDESGDEQERAEEYAKLIDDADGNEADGEALAAMMADENRAKDEATVQRLYKDITTGALRRKRGQAFDLSDSEDDLENRRRMKRREFERMRKALMADEAVEKIASNPKKNAFMKCLEDREDLDFEFLEDDEGATPSTEEAATPVEQDGQKEAAPAAPAPQPKAPLAETTANAAKPTNPRRTGLMAKPASILEIKRALSSLIDDPHNAPPPVNVEEEQETPEKRLASPRRSRVQVIDRAKLKALNAAQQTTEAVREAFRVGGAQQSNGGSRDEGEYGGPKLLLLRRSSTLMSNASMNSNSSRSSGANTPSMNSGDSVPTLSRSSTMEGKSAKGGRSVAINYNAREAIRKKAIEGKDKLRLKKKLARADKTRQAFGNIIGSGYFD